MKRKVVILGATGSIGQQALEIIRQNPNLFEVEAVCANVCEQKLKSIAYEFNIDSSKTVLVAKDGLDAANCLAQKVDKNGNQFSADVVLNAITGSVGLKSTLSCLSSDTLLALANKESLVAGGELVKQQIGQQMTKRILPVDSEHSAIWQSLNSGDNKTVDRLILTASGGPFRNITSHSELNNITPEQALNHPTWNMGKVVTINSSTLMNKALELIEAAYLFDVHPKNIDVVIHPQSIIHSMVQYCDGSIISQMSNPDMKLPIALALANNSSEIHERIEGVTEPINLKMPHNLEFKEVNHQLFPFINLARELFDKNPLYLTVMNAANEEAVYAFLDQTIAYLQIYKIVDQVINKFEPNDFINNISPLSIDIIDSVEIWARSEANSLINNG